MHGVMLLIPFSCPWGASELHRPSPWMLQERGQDQVCLTLQVHHQAFQTFRASCPSYRLESVTDQSSAAGPVVYQL